MAHEGPSLPHGRGIASLPANSFGLIEAAGGYVVGFVLSGIALAAYDAASHHPGRTSGLGPETVGLVALWAGFWVALVVAHARPAPEPKRPLLRRLRDDYGLTIRPIDVPLGIAAGLFAQYLLVPLLELPLAPFVPNLFHRLSDPAQSRITGVSGFGLVTLGLLICVGSPFFEELYFRGLILRAIAGKVASHFAGRATLSAATSILCSAVLFGLVHYEPLELLGLIGAGAVFGVLAAATRRLGAGMVAHAAFNGVAYLSVVHVH